MGNIRPWSKEMGIVCSAVYLHGPEYLRGLECFYGRGDMSNISEESNLPWWITIPAYAVIFILLIMAIRLEIAASLGYDIIGDVVKIIPPLWGVIFSWFVLMAIASVLYIRRIGWCKI